MAVEDKYVNAEIVAGRPADAVQSTGAQETKVIVTEEIAAADDDGSVYRLIKGLPQNMIVADIEVLNDAITAGTDYDIGLYETDTGDVVDKDCYADGLDLSSGHASGSGLSGISAVDVANRHKKVYEIAGHTKANRKGSYDLCLTGNTVGSAAGTVTAIISLLQG